MADASRKRCRRALERYRTFEKGEPQVDDVTALVVKRLPPT